jgi:ribosomal protein S18 acetylase RimI-like enzyme
MGQERRQTGFGGDLEVRIRNAGSEDLAFLWEMLYQAIYWGPERQEPKPPREELLSNPEISHYLAGWGQEGDTALIAVDDRDGRGIGAAWYRLMPPEDSGYGFVDASTPEMGLAVVSHLRGRGVGGALLRALLDRARSEGLGAVSLSVEQENPVVRLYERHGFTRLFADGNAWIMKVELPKG